MVEVRVIKEGVSGLPKKVYKGKARVPKKTSERDRTTNGHFTNAKEYFAVAAKTAKKMQNANKKEHQHRMPTKQLRKMLKENLTISNPNLGIEAIEKLVDQNLPTVLKAYNGKPALQPVISDEVKAVYEARKAERKQLVKARRICRKENQKPSQADLAWMATGRR